MIKKAYISYSRQKVFAIFYKSTRTVFFNEEFRGGTRVILMI